jgi:hypothetical protein
MGGSGGLRDRLSELCNHLLTRSVESYSPSGDHNGQRHSGKNPFSHGKIMRVDFRETTHQLDAVEITAPRIGNDSVGLLGERRYCQSIIAGASVAFFSGRNGFFLRPDPIQVRPERHSLVQQPH